MTRSRCKTGYKIKRCCSRCTMWELWHNGLPLPEERCTTWEEARDRFIALTCGRHDRLALGMGACRVAVRRPGGRHRPAKGTWDASWLLFPQTYVLGAEHEPIPYALV